MVASGVLQVASPNYWVFISFIFINAIGTSGIFPLAMVLGAEMVGRRKREITALILNYFYPIGGAFTAAISYWMPDWTHFQLIISAPAAIFMVYYWIVPESVRWLLAKGKRAEAKKTFLKVAKYNKVALSDDLMDSFDETTRLQNISDADKSDNIYPVLKDLLLSKKIIFRFVIIYFLWAVNSFIFFGLSINSTALSGNKYINFTLVSLVEIPGCTLSWITMKKLGRKISLIGSLLLCGITCLSTIFVQSTGLDWAVIALFLTGKLGIASSFSTAYVFTSEMMPTILRSVGVGSCTAIGRIGALLAPYVPFLALYWDPLPMIVFAFFAVVAGLLAVMLPETSGVKLPETAEEAKLL